MKKKPCHSNDTLRFYKLICFIAYKFPVTTVCNFDDYVQAGNLAAIKAVNSYNANCGTKLSSYVGICAFRAMMTTYLKNKYSFSISDNNSQRLNKIKFLKKMGKSVNEICEELHISKKQLCSFKILLKNKRDYNNILDSKNYNSLEYLIDSNLNINLVDKQILMMRLEGYTLKEVGKEFGKSAEWVRNRIKKISLNNVNLEESK